MIQDVLSITGTYADLWSYYKSIDHALERVLSLDTGDIELADLDYERIEELARFLNESFVKPPTIDFNNPASLVSFLSDRPIPRFTINSDLKKKLFDIPDLKSYLSGKGLEYKIERLVVKMKEWVENNKANRQIVPPTVLKKEFYILRDITSVLLEDAQLRMY